MEQQTSVHARQDSGVPASARDFGVEGKVVIITGAGQGIGRDMPASSQLRARWLSLPISI